MKKTEVIQKQNYSDNNSKQSNHNYSCSSHSLDLLTIDLDNNNDKSEMSVTCENPNSQTIVDIPIQNAIVVNESQSSIKFTCLLIGLCFNRKIITGLKRNEMTGIIHLADNKGKMYNQSVVRDTWQCQAIENNFSNTRVVTCSILSDSYRHLEDDTNMNCDCNSSRFVSNITSKLWKINEVYVDSIRI